VCNFISCTSKAPICDGCCDREVVAEDWLHRVGRTAWQTPICWVRCATEQWWGRIRRLWQSNVAASHSVRLLIYRWCDLPRRTLKLWFVKFKNIRLRIHWRSKSIGNCQKRNNHSLPQKWPEVQRLNAQQDIRHCCTNGSALASWIFHEIILWMLPGNCIGVAREARGSCSPKLFNISSHFVFWEAESKTKILLLA